MSVKRISDREFKASIDNDELTVVEFGATWCPPCKNLLPILDDLDREFKGILSIYSMDADDSPDATSEFGIMSLPTVIIFKNGQPMERLIGLRPRQVYRNLIAKCLA